MARFARITSIAPENPASWERKLFLTIDIDWAADRVLEHTVELVEAAGVPATFFVTHPTPVLKRIRSNPNFELGIHPNFNNILDGKSDGRDARGVVAELLDLVPEAKAVRSHSTTQSSRLLDLFSSRGLTHDCNEFIPAQSRIELRPYRRWTGLVRAPYFWEDDVDLMYGSVPPIGELAAQPGLKIFDFHPIHVALNTTDMKEYDRSRAAHRDWEALQSYVCPGFGVRERLRQLFAEGAR